MRGHNEINLIIFQTDDGGEAMSVGREGEEISGAHSWFFVGYAKSWTKWILVKGKAAAKTEKSKGHLVC